MQGCCGVHCRTSPKKGICRGCFYHFPLWVFQYIPKGGKSHCKVLQGNGNDKEGTQGGRCVLDNKRMMFNGHGVLLPYGRFSCPPLACCALSVLLPVQRGNNGLGAFFGGNKDENLIPVGSRTKEELREMARKARGNPCRTLGAWMDETPMGIATGGYGSIMAVELRANLGEMCYLLICLVG